MLEVLGIIFIIIGLIIILFLAYAKLIAKAVLKDIIKDGYFILDGIQYNVDINAFYCSEFIDKKPP